LDRAHHPGRPQPPGTTDDRPRRLPHLEADSLQYWPLDLGRPCPGRISHRTGPFAPGPHHTPQTPTSYRQQDLRRQQAATLIHDTYGRIVFMLNDPHITVATLVEKEGRFLMVEERSNGAIVFNQPAGHVEEGESLVEAALRETLEESGWQVRLSGFLGSYVLTIPDKGRTYYRFCFIAEAGRQVSQHLDTDIIAA